MKTKLFVLPLFVLCWGFTFAQNNTYQVNYNKMNQLLRAINDLYVDTVNFDKIVENATVEMLKELEDGKVVLVELKNISQVGERALSTLLSKKLLKNYSL